MDDVGVSKLSANFHFKVNFKILYCQYDASPWCFAVVLLFLSYINLISI